MKSHEQFLVELEEVNPNIQVLGKYVKASEPIEVKCRKCGKVWKPKAYSLLSGKGCSHCSAIEGAKNNTGKTGLKNKQLFITELNYVQPNIKVVGNYVNTHSDIDCICLRCGHKWSSKPYSLLQKHGCPRCAKSGTSFMEQTILLAFCFALGEDKVLSRNKSCIGLELDIYVPSLNFAIEIGSWLLHKKSVHRDEQKRIKCNEKNVRLITIYDKYPQDKEPIFDTNFFSFEEDLNKANHSILHKLIYDLFLLVNVNKKISCKDWHNIEKLAYENSKSMTQTEFLQKMQKVHPNIKVLGCYCNCNTRIEVQCSVCNHKWFGVPSNMLAGDGCKACGVKKAHKNTIRSQVEFLDELKMMNPNVEIIGEYTGRHNPIKCKCKICGIEWDPVAGSLLRGSTHKGAKYKHSKE